MKKLQLTFFLLCIAVSTMAQWSTSSTNIYNTNRGNVGIGITTPSNKLDVNGTISFSNSLRENSLSNKLILNVGSGVGTELHAGDVTGIIFKDPWNNEKVRISSSGSVGIGTTTPSNKLDVNGTISFSNSLRENSLSNKLILNVGSGVGTELHAGDVTGIIFKDPWNNEKVRISSSGNVGIGTTTPDEKLTVKGKIHAEEVIIDLNVPAPDYVFAPDYQLRDLDELQQFIETNKHLPEVPSAATMEEEGISVSEMNMLLLKKVEELTLYILQQEKRIEKLENKN